MSRSIFLALFLACTAGLFAQHQNIMISSSYSPNEPSITVNPKNTDQLYAGANLANYYYSDDAGQTWQSGILVSIQNGVYGDPVLICDTAGAFYYFHLANPPEGGWIDRIVCQKVGTFGGEWNDGTYMGLNGTKNQDKQWAAVDQHTNNIYVTWTQFDDYASEDPADSSNILFSRSTDGGATWSQAKRINHIAGDCLDDDNTVEGAVPTVGPDGQIYVSWAGPAGIVFDRSFDQGDTWLDDDIFVCDIGGGWAYDIPVIYRCNGMPVTVCDTSQGPYSGTIYINFSDQRNGPDDTDVWLVKSVDGGDTWSEPVRVNDDPPGRQQFFTWMTIDQSNGYLYFVFYDRRNYADNNTDIYMAQSTDGGATFTNFKVSESPMLLSSGAFIGDYTNITAHNNVIRPIWTRLQSGQSSIWTAIVDTAAVGVQELAQNTSSISMEQNYPNPFSESTRITFNLRNAAPVNLAVYDQLGRRIEVLIDGELLHAGKYSYQFNAWDKNLAPGVYYFSLVSNDQVVRQKILLAR